MAMADISKYLLVVYAALIGGFLSAPISTMVLFSFNSSSRTVPPFDGPSLNWYNAALGSAQIVDAFTRSLLLGVVTTVLATALFTLAGLAYRRSFRGGPFFFYFFAVGLIIPAITYSLGLNF